MRRASTENLVIQRQFVAGGGGGVVGVVGSGKLNPQPLKTGHDKKTFQYGEMGSEGEAGHGKG